MDDSDSDSDSAPPNAVGVQDVSTSLHPLWATAKAGGAKMPPPPSRKRKTASSEAGDKPSATFARIDASKLAAAQMCGESSGSEEDVGEEEDEDEEEGQQAQLSGLAAVAFGGKQKAKQSVAGSSVAGSVKHKNQFPKKVHCTGCLLAHRIGAVERFVSTNVLRIERENLYRLAASVYKDKVFGPLAASGQTPPTWGWRSLMVHFECHSALPNLSRAATLRTLQQARSVVEGRLMRQEAGEEEPDSNNLKLLLSIVAQEGKERALLEAAEKPKALAQQK
jgi:hypothetical protein